MNSTAPDPDPLRCTARALAKADEYTRHVIKESGKNGRPVTCAKGCFHCCKEPVYATREEAQYLVSRLSESHRAALVDEVRKWWDTFRQDGLIDLQKSEPGEGFGNLLRYRASNLYCPLLKDGCCSAYEGRPLGCRMHLVSGPVKRCSDDALRPSQVFVRTDGEAEFMQLIFSIQYYDTAIVVVELDHLGVWLAHLLLGAKERSQAGSDATITRS